MMRVFELEQHWMWRRMYFALVLCISVISWPRGFRFWRHHSLYSMLQRRMMSLSAADSCIVVFDVVASRSSVLDHTHTRTYTLDIRTTLNVAVAWDWSTDRQTDGHSMQQRLQETSVFPGRVSERLNRDPNDARRIPATLLCRWRVRLRSYACHYKYKDQLQH